MTTAPDLTGFADDVDTAPLTYDRIFELLANEHRRRLLYALRAETRLPLADAALILASWETGRPIDTVPAATLDAVELSLEHAHVPKLGRHDVIDFDETDRVITRGPQASLLLSVMEASGVLAAIEDDISRD